jgi:DNA-binding XRE family transcriptional regulator
MNREWEPRKLSLHNAEKIREYYNQGASQNWLATKFEVSKRSIKLIVQGKTYREGA